MSTIWLMKFVIQKTSCKSLHAHLLMRELYYVGGEKLLLEKEYFVVFSVSFAGFCLKMSI